MVREKKKSHLEEMKEFWKTINEKCCLKVMPNWPEKTTIFNNQ